MMNRPMMSLIALPIVAMGLFAWMWLYSSQASATLIPFAAWKKKMASDSGPFITTKSPTPRMSHTAVWTGSRMIIWGGGQNVLTCMRSGSQYDPVADTWSATTGIGAPYGCMGHSAVWTGDRMIVWGGMDEFSFNMTESYFHKTGASYNPSTDQWTPLSVTGAPVARAGHTAVWTGDKMITWGGRATTLLNTGGVYDPIANSWTVTSTTNAPLARTHHAAVWTGSKMLVYGGFSDSDGDRHFGFVMDEYNPSTNTWESKDIKAGPTPRYSAHAFWTGTTMIVSGGSNSWIIPYYGEDYYPVQETFFYEP